MRTRLTFFRSLRVEWLRQLSLFSCFTDSVLGKMVEFDDSAEHAECLESLEYRIRKERLEIDRDVDRLSRRLASTGDNFAALSTSSLLLRHGILSQRDVTYVDPDRISSRVEQSLGLGDFGTALMMQESILLCPDCSIWIETFDIVEEVQRYFKIQNDFIHRLRSSYKPDAPLIPPGHFLLALTKNSCFLQTVVDLQSPQEKDHLGRSLLHVALDYNCVEEVPWLLDRSYSINERDRLGRSALHLACFNGSTDVVETLLKNGADITATNALRFASSALCSCKWMHVYCGAASYQIRH